jgi:hypothetical protein
MDRTMDEQPSQYMRWRLQARCWRNALLWVSAIAALALAAWMATYAAFDAMSGTTLDRAHESTM